LLSPEECRCLALFQFRNRVQAATANLEPFLFSAVSGLREVLRRHGRAFPLLRLETTHSCEGFV